MLGSAAHTEDIQVELLLSYIKTKFTDSLLVFFILVTLVQYDGVITGLGKNFSSVLVCVQRSFDPVIQRNFTYKLHLGYKKKLQAIKGGFLIRVL